MSTDVPLRDVFDDVLSNVLPDVLADVLGDVLGDIFGYVLGDVFGYVLGDDLSELLAEIRCRLSACPLPHTTRSTEAITPPRRGIHRARLFRVWGSTRKLYSVYLCWINSRSMQGQMYIRVKDKV